MSDYTVLLPLDGDEASETALLVLPMLRTIGFSKLRLIAVDDTSNQKTRTAEAFKPYLAEKQAAAEAGAEVTLVAGPIEDLGENRADASAADDHDLHALSWGVSRITQTRHGAFLKQ